MTTTEETIQIANKCSQNSEKTTNKLKTEDPTKTLRKSIEKKSSAWNQSEVVTD